MKFDAPVASFLKPLQQLSALAGITSNPEDIANNILIRAEDNTLYMKATNYHVELSYTADVNVIEPGATSVNAMKLREACSRLDNNAAVLFEYDPIDEILQLKSGSTSYKVRTRSADDFPDMLTDEVDQVLLIKADQLRAVIERSAFCVSNEDFREYLRGLRFEVDGGKLTVFASDGHRMSINEVDLVEGIDTSYGITLIKPCAIELLKILQNSVGAEDVVKLSFAKNNMTTSFNNYHLTSKLLICKYPNVRAILPRTLAISVPVNRTMLKQSISRVSVLTSKRVNGVTFSFDKGVLHLHSENTEHEVATDSIAIDYDGEPFEISLNASYVNDVLNALAFCELIVFNFIQLTQLSSTLISPSIADQTGVQTSYFIARVVV